MRTIQYEGERRKDWKRSTRRSKPDFRSSSPAMRRTSVVIPDKSSRRRSVSPEKGDSFTKKSGRRRSVAAPTSVQRLRQRNPRASKELNFDDKRDDYASMRLKLKTPELGAARRMFFELDRGAHTPFLPSIQNHQPYIHAPLVPACA